MIKFKEKEKYGNCIGIYQIRNIKDNYVYIGQTNERFVRRLWLHDFLLRNNKHDNINLQNAYNENGEDAFIFETLYVVESKTDLDKLEKECIKNARKQGVCYNISDGGKGATGVHMTEANRKFHAEHNRILNTGKKASEETKKKMSQTKKGKPIKEETLNKMLKTKAEKYLSGNKNKLSKITAVEAKEIKIALMNNVSYDELSEKYSVSKSNINAIRSNRSWKFVEVEGWNKYCEANKRISRA